MQPDFRELVYGYVAQIPRGRVMTYGQLAALAGHPRAARQVGGIAHFGPSGLPWHRVVNKQGRLAAGYHGGRPEQAVQLEGEGVEVRDDHIDVASLIWWPKE